MVGRVEEGSKWRRWGWGEEDRGARVLLVLGPPLPSPPPRLAPTLRGKVADLLMLPHLPRSKSPLDNPLLLPLLVLARPQAEPHPPRRSGLLTPASGLLAPHNNSSIFFFYH